MVGCPISNLKVQGSNPRCCVPLHQQLLNGTLLFEAAAHIWAFTIPSCDQHHVLGKVYDKRLTKSDVEIYHHPLLVRFEAHLLA